MGFYVIITLNEFQYLDLPRHLRLQELIGGFSSESVQFHCACWSSATEFVSGINKNKEPRATTVAFVFICIKIFHLPLYITKLYHLETPTDLYVALRRFFLVFVLFLFIII